MEEADRTISLGRRFVKLRFIASVFYEAMLILEEFEKVADAEKLKAKLDGEGIEALKKLRAIRCGEDSTIRDLLERTRNFATFHYLEVPFRDALLKMYGYAPRGFPAAILYEGDDQRRWYPIAEHLKIETAFNIAAGDEELKKRLDVIVERLDDFATVLKQLFEAYINVRGLIAIFPIGTLDPTK
jgi:hypothetical protein